MCVHACLCYTDKQSIHVHMQTSHKCGASSNQHLLYLFQRRNISSMLSLPSHSSKHEHVVSGTGLFNKGARTACLTAEM